MTSPVSSESVPAEARGIWADSVCEPGNTHYLVNNGFVMIFVSQRGETQLVFGPVEWVAGTPLLQRPEGIMLLPRLSTLQRCQALPASYYAWFGESIALFQAYDDAAQRCQDSTVENCAEVIFGLLDITGDGRLSMAEISRGLRGIGPLLAYEVIVAGRKDSGESGARLLVDITELFSGSLLGSVGGRLVVETVLRTYDYDGDGFISLEELLQDRGPVHTASVAAVIAAPTIHAAVVGIVQGLRELIGTAAGGVFGAILR